MRWLATLMLLVAAHPAAAQDPQVQADLGLAVIGADYEQPIVDHVSVQVEAHIFGTYFLPWFMTGDAVKGYGGGVRPSWFMTADGRGLYVAPFFRIDHVADDFGSSGTAWSAGVFGGWAFGLTRRLDLRVGGGAQYIHYALPTAHAHTPFIALDLVIGYRL